MVVGAGSFQLPAIRKAQQMGFEVVAVDGNPDAPGLREAEFPHTADIKSAVECIRIARENRVVGVLTVAAEAAVRTVAAVAEALGLPGLNPAGAEVATDKSLMRERFAQHGVPSPLFATCRSFENARASACKIGLPVVVKPADSAGSRGVSLVTDEKMLESAFNNALYFSSKHLVLVEQFMPGVEISAEAFVYRGEVHIIALSDKVRTPPPYLMDTEVLFPSEQDFQIQREAREIARLAIRACEIDDATVHMEQIVTPEGPKVVELAARGAGFHVFTDMVPWVTGIDTVAQLIRISTGQAPTLQVCYQRGCVLTFLKANPGVVHAVAGIESARRLPGIFDASVYVAPGDQVRPLRSGADRVGHVIAFGSTRAEAVQRAREAQDTISISTEV